MTVEAFICVKAAPGNEDAVVSQLAEADPKNPKAFKIKGMKEVYRTSGDWDAIAVVEASDLGGISRIEDQINSLESSGKTKGKPVAYVVTDTRILPRIIKPVGDP
jgi:DNA-binding Lrp family transcriptional regulator